jgi:hypothetical protein
MRARMIAKGLLTFVLPRRLFNRPYVPADPALYCYNVFIHHLVRVHPALAGGELGHVAELGPGGSLGVGFAALLAGATRYFAFDVQPYVRQDDELRTFDRLVTLFKERAAPENCAFPRHILSDALFARTLDPARLDTFRTVIRAGQFDRGPISYVAPWHDGANLQPGTIDWFMSNAVLEHVDDLDPVYRTIHQWLAVGGVMSHQIDFRSHATATAWDGHRAYSDPTWRLIRGRRDHLINRQPLSLHREIPARLGFELVDQAIMASPPTLARAQRAARFRGWSDEDLAAAGALLVHHKMGEGAAAEQRLRPT